jgi:hypothetical protein
VGCQRRRRRRRRSKQEAVPLIFLFLEAKATAFLTVSLLLPKSVVAIFVITPYYREPQKDPVYESYHGVQKTPPALLFSVPNSVLTVSFREENQLFTFALISLLSVRTLHRT